MREIKKFIKNNWWAILAVLCFVMLGIVIGTMMQAAADVIAFYLTHAFIAG